MSKKNCLEKMNINENLSKVFESNNFWKFFLRTYKLKNDINSFLECGLNLLEDIEVDENMKNKIIKKIYNSHYNKKFFDVIGDYIIDSKYIRDDAYKNTVLYLHGLEDFSKKIKLDLKKGYPYFSIKSKISNKEKNIISNKVVIKEENGEEILYFKPLDKNDIQNLNFQQILDIINYIENSVLSFIEKEEVDNFYKEEIEELLYLWKQDKNNFYEKFDEIKNNRIASIDCDEEKLIKYMKTRIMSKYYPKVLNIFYNYLGDTFIGKTKDYNKLSFDVNDITKTKIGNKEIEKLNELKKFILKFNSFSFKYIFEPIFFSRLSNYLEYDVNTTQWKRIKFLMLFGISDSYDEYIKIFDFFTKIETFLGNSFFDKFKIWGFWTVTLPIFLIIFSFFLPLGAFVSLLVIVGGILWKVIKDIKVHTDYKITFNFGINIVATLSFSVFLGSSIFLTSGDAYKFGYEKLKGAINVLSSTTFADVLNYSNNKGEIWGAGKNTGKKQNSIMNYNYLEQGKSFYDINITKNISEEDNIEKYKNKNSNIENKRYFSGKKVKLSDGVYLWNLVKKVLTRHIIEKDIQMSNKEKFYITKQIIKHYISLNIDYIRKSSVLKNSYKMKWNELTKWMPTGYEVNMDQIEDITISILN